MQTRVYARFLSVCQLRSKVELLFLYIQVQQKINQLSFITRGMQSVVVVVVVVVAAATANQSPSEIFFQFHGMI